MNVLLKPIIARFWRYSGLSRERDCRRNFQAGEPVYYIVRRIMEWGGGGFFSNYFYAMSHIAYARSMGYVPVVDMQRYRTFYSEKAPILGTRNDWERYFPATVSLEVALRSRNYILSPGSLLRTDFYPILEDDDSCSVDPEIQSRIFSLCRADVFPLRSVTAPVDEWFQTRFGDSKVLGIHYRGTDKREAHVGHRLAAGETELIQCAAEMCRRDGISKVFLASDEERVFRSLSEALPCPVFRMDCFRAGDLADLGSKFGPRFHKESAGLHNSNLRQPRTNHRYRLGLEVLQDAWALSRCTHLLCGHSNVSSAAMFFRETPFQEVRVVSSGAVKA